MKNKKKIDFSEMEADEKIKYEVAEELGLLDIILRNGWKSLSSKETGKIGGIVAKKKKESKTQNLEKKQ